jgi:hypothetical protein
MKGDRGLGTTPSSEPNGPQHLCLEKIAYAYGLHFQFQNLTTMRVKSVGVKAILVCMFTFYC